MSIDLKKLAHQISVEIELEARKLHARITSTEAQMISKLGELTAATIYKETVGGEERNEADWRVIGATTHNIAVADAILFQNTVGNIAKTFLGAIKTVLPILS